MVVLVGSGAGVVAAGDLTCEREVAVGESVRAVQAQTEGVLEGATRQEQTRDVKSPALSSPR